MPLPAYDLALAAQQERDKMVRIDLILQFMDIVLMDDSAQLLRKRVASKTNTIGLPRMMEVLTWLMEQYGLRPTAPSLPSSSE